MRIIPKTAKVKIEFFKNVSVVDIIIVLITLILEVLTFTTNWNYLLKAIVMVLILCFIIALFIPFDGQRFYMFFVNFMKYLFSVKSYSSKYDASTNINNFIPFKDIQDGFIVYNDYYAGVLEIDPREFRLLTGFRQDQIIDNCFGKLIRSISNKEHASLVKIDRNLSFEQYIKLEEEKMDTLKKMFETGDLSQEEMFNRGRIIEDRIKVYQTLNEKKKVTKPFYYFVIYESEKEAILELLNNGISALRDAGMESRILGDRELAVFLKYNYTNDFDEDAVNQLSSEELVNWIKPEEVRFTSNSAFIDGVETFTYTIKGYPINVLNAWGYQLFNIRDTKVVMNLEPYEKEKAIKMIDRSLQELLSQTDEAYRASSFLDKQTHIQTLVELLTRLQNDNEVLFKVTIHITAYRNSAEGRKDLRKKIRRILSEDGFDIVDNYYRQNKANISTNLSAYEALPDFTRAIHSSSVAAVFPFVLSTIMDKKGVLVGQNSGFPVIVDFFRRDEERVNSNMVIMGKSGSGKSYATKTILGNLAAENTKVFILDPEDEYTILARNLGGQYVDVGAATSGRINPFHIITTLESDESEGSVSNFSIHLQFLEEFFKQILVGIDAQALEYLNNIIIELYNLKGINSRTNISALKPEDYPIFDDLFALITEKLQTATVDYDLTNLRMLSNFIAKFAGEGRDANLWNGPSTLTIKENFTVFNFRSLLANKNGTIANAQMLLVLRWLDNEIIKNRDFNLKYRTNRKIIVAIDEAHVFIDEKFPVALDFMFNLAKRIRKYNGMQIVITQNIKDFVGSPEIVRKSSAIINACQYSFIFALSPNDMDDLCKLYDKAGRINESEQEQIVNNERGNAFIITSPTSRNSLAIVASNKVEDMFTE